jgi:hypothetical protein
LITIKESRFSLPTDPISQKAFTFAPVPYDSTQAITLKTLLTDPAARRKFDAWDGVVIRHAATRGDERRISAAARATTDWVARGGYEFEIERAPSWECQRRLREVDFLFGNIVRPAAKPMPQPTEYVACAGRKVVARYTSLTTDDWTEETLPALHESITRLFDGMLVNIVVQTRYRPPPPQHLPARKESYHLLDPKLRPKDKVLCKTALSTGPLSRGKRGIDETIGFGQVFGKTIEASDCSRDQILDYVKGLGGVPQQEPVVSTNATYYYFYLNTFEYPWYLFFVPERLVILAFDRSGTLIFTNWGRYK